ncbi:MAG TPA: MFS transporter [Solirubrobacteraceae bacterium]|nr:MFS transporter [Solirubrobacteraceae bacterium]
MAGANAGEDGAVSVDGARPTRSLSPPRAAPETVRYATARGRWVLAVTVLGSGMGFLDATVVNVALPAIAADLDAGTAGLQWTVNGYLLTLASLILLGGSLADRLGRRRMFSFGVLWFTVASLLCALAPSVELLVVARVAQGVGGALLTPGSLAIIESSFRREDRARAIGAWSALTGIAAAIGPLVGGYLIGALAWRWIFLINLPLGRLAAFLAARHVPESRDEGATGRLDLGGSMLAAVGLGGVTFALIGASGGGYAPAAVLVAGLGGALALAVFVAVERRVADPMLPLGIFASRQFTAANLVTFAVYAALGSVFFFLVVYLQTSLGYSPLAAGAASLPVTALMFLLSSRAGALAQRVGPRLPLTVGPLFLAGAMLLMLRIDPGDGYVATVLPAVVVFGLGLAATVAPVTATALAAAAEHHSGLASGVNNAVSRVAQLLAIAVLPLVAGLSGEEFTDPRALAAGFEIAMAAAAALAVAGAALAFLTIRDDVLEQGGETEEHRPAVHHRNCAVAGTPLHPREPVVQPGPSRPASPAPS